MQRMSPLLVLPALLFVALLLLLLVSLSTPIIDSIYLFRLTAHASSSLFKSGVSAQVHYGVWGYCYSGIQISVIGIKKTSDAGCSDARLGYTFDSAVADALNADEILDLISRTTTAALVLHPIATVLTFLVLLILLFTLLRPASRGSDPSASNRPFTIVAFVIGLLAAILTTIAFLIDVIFVAVLRKRVRDATDGTLNLHWGNAVWMTLAAAVLLWPTVIYSIRQIMTPRKRIPDTY